MTATRIRTNGQNQTTWAIPAAAFGDAEIPAVYARESKGGRVFVTTGARCSALAAATPPADRAAAIAKAAVAAGAAEHRSNAGYGRVDTHHWMAAMGATLTEATRTWRALAPTRVRKARATRVVRPVAEEA